MTTESPITRWQKRIGARLRELRGERSLDEVAEAAGVVDQTLRNYELGVRPPRVDILCRLADYYEVTLDWLVGREWTESDATEPTWLLIPSVYRRHAEALPEQRWCLGTPFVRVDRGLVLISDRRKTELDMRLHHQKGYSS